MIAHTAWKDTKNVEMIKKLVLPFVFTMGDDVFQGVALVQFMLLKMGC